MFIPRLHVPAAFVFGLLNEGDVAVGLHQGDAALDEFAIGLRPVRGQLGDGLGAVALEPRGLQLAGGQLAGHHDFKGAFAELEGRHLVGRQDELGFREAVKLVALPIEFLLEGNHALERFGPALLGGIERGARVTGGYRQHSSRRMRVQLSG